MASIVIFTSCSLSQHFLKPTHKLPTPKKFQSFSFSRNALSGGSSITDVNKKTDKKAAEAIAEKILTNHGFVEEMRMVAMRLHKNKDRKEAVIPPVAHWKPTIDGYLKFLVDSKFLYDTFDAIIKKSYFPDYDEFKNADVIAISENLIKDFEWFKEQGRSIPEPSPSGVSYVNYIKILSEKDPQAFICHFYNIYMAHHSGGKIIGKKVAETILDNKELHFYKSYENLPQLLQTVNEKMNDIAETWTREQKDHCLEETEKSFIFFGDVLRLVIS